MDTSCCDADKHVEATIKDTGKSPIEVKGEAESRVETVDHPVDKVEEPPELKVPEFTYGDVHHTK